MGTLEELETLKLRLNDADRRDDALFTELVGKASALLRFTDMELAEAADVSRPSATRWKNGTVVPHPGFRPAVFKFLRKKVDDALRTAKQVAADRSSSSASRPATRSRTSRRRSSR